MPKDGFKSITLKNEVYEHLQAQYEKIKGPLAICGINSFSGFITYSLNKLYSDEAIFDFFVRSMGNEMQKALNKLKEKGHA